MMGRPRRTDFTTCNQGESCVNPNQGKLTEYDYHLNQNRRKSECKACVNLKNRERDKTVSPTAIKQKPIEYSMAQQWLCGWI